MLRSSPTPYPTMFPTQQVLYIACLPEPGAEEAERTIVTLFVDAFDDTLYFVRRKIEDACGVFVEEQFLEVVPSLDGPDPDGDATPAVPLCGGVGDIDRELAPPSCDDGTATLDESGIDPFNTLVLRAPIYLACNSDYTSVFTWYADLHETLVDGMHDYIEENCGVERADQVVDLVDGRGPNVVGGRALFDNDEHALSGNDRLREVGPTSTLCDLRRTLPGAQTCPFAVKIEVHCYPVRGRDTEP